MKIPKFSQYKIYIRKYFDFSQKYGIGYVMSTGAYGIIFNDDTKIFLDAQSKYLPLLSSPGSSTTLRQRTTSRASSPSR